MGSTFISIISLISVILFLMSRKSRVEFTGSVISTPFEMTVCQSSKTTEVNFDWPPFWIGLTYRDLQVAQLFVLVGKPST